MSNERYRALCTVHYLGIRQFSFQPLSTWNKRLASAPKICFPRLWWKPLCQTSELQDFGIQNPLCVVCRGDFPYLCYIQGQFYIFIGNYDAINYCGQVFLNFKAFACQHHLSYLLTDTFTILFRYCLLRFIKGIKLSLQYLLFLRYMP